MKQIIEPSIIKGVIEPPASKSLTQRAFAAALIKNGTSIIHQAGNSNDEKAALEIIQQLGATIKTENNQLHVQSKGFNASTHILNTNINCLESGLCLRMFTPILALHNTTINITGSGSLLNRPIHFFDDVLPLLNVQVTTTNGKLPLQIKGALIPKNIEVDGSISSQFLSGLIFAYAAYLVNEKNTLAPNFSYTIHVNNLTSKPYIDLTLQVLKDFGLPVPQNNHYTDFTFNQHSFGRENKTIIQYQVESDWSNMSFLLVAAAIAGNITIKNINLNSLQADKEILNVLKSCGANFSIHNNEISITNSTLQAFSFNATDCPDLFPPLVALAAYCNGTSIIKGVNRLIYKESNRCKSLQEEFCKMGVNIVIENDSMIITGSNKIIGANIQTHQDHRIAMACAVAALQANGITVINESEVVQKSYPMFFQHLKLLGANIFEG